MEYLTNNKVQYQPYREDGTRVEIPAEEDAILTAATEAWDPPYGWPDLPLEPESIVEPGSEPQTIEPEPQTIEPEPQTIEPEPQTIEPEPQVVEPEPEPEPIVEPGLTVDSESVVELKPAESMESGSNLPTTEPEYTVTEPKREPEVVLTGVKTDKTEATKTESNEASKKEIKMTEATEVSTGIGTRDSGANTGETGSVNDVVAEGMEKVKSGDTLDYGEAGVMDAVESMTKETAEALGGGGQNEVEIPELGQGTGKKPNIAASVAIIAGVGAALVAAWWFLFLGKHKSKEGKEGKE